MITWGWPKTPDCFPFKEKIYSKTKLVVKQEEDEMRITKSDGACLVSPPSQRPAWPSSPLSPSESLRLWLSSCLTTSAAICARTPAPLIPAEVQGLNTRGHSPSLWSHTHWRCLLFPSQIQGMTALPPAIERPSKTEPLMCTSPSSSLHRSLSPQLLVCLTVLGSLLSSLHSWSSFCGPWWRCFLWLETRFTCGLKTLGAWGVWRLPFHLLPSSPLSRSSWEMSWVLSFSSDMADKMYPLPIKQNWPDQNVHQVKRK